MNLFNDSNKSDERSQFIQNLRSSKAMRKREKESNRAATVIQKHRRRVISSRAARRNLRLDMANKLNDIEILEVRLLQVGAVKEFVLPGETFEKLLRQLSFYYGQDEEALSEDKLHLALLSKYFIQLWKYESSSSTDAGLEHKRTSLERYRHIWFGNAIAGILTDPLWLSTNLNYVKNFVVLFSLFNGGMIDSWLKGFENHSCKRELGFTSSLSFDRPFCDLSYAIEATFLQNLQSNLNAIFSSERGYPKDRNRFAKAVFVILVIAACYCRKKPSYFLQYVLSIPSLRQALGASLLQSLFNENQVFDILIRCLNLVSTDCEVLCKEYVLSNLLVIFQALDNENSLRKIIGPGTSFVAELLDALPDIYKGEDMLIWHRSGPSQIASNIPTLLIDDLLLLCNKAFVKRILDCVLQFDTKTIEIHDSVKMAQEINILEDLQDKTNIEPSLEAKSRPYWKLFEELWHTKGFRKTVLTSKGETNSHYVLQSQGTLKDSKFSKHNFGSCMNLLSEFFVKASPCTKNPKSLNLLNFLCFGYSRFSYWLWLGFQQFDVPRNDRQMRDFLLHAETDRNAQYCLSTLHVFATVTNHLLFAIDNKELYEQSKPISRGDIEDVIIFCKSFLYSWLVNKERLSQYDHYVGIIGKLMFALHERNSRKPLCKISDWILSKFKNSSIVKEELLESSTFQLVLSHMPYAIPFKDRVRIFNWMINKDKLKTQKERSYKVVIHRERLFEDGYKALSKAGRNIRGRMHIVFINAFGQQEKGIDAGGLFKEFWTNLAKIVFSPEYGLFVSTQDGQLYPNPGSEIVHPGNHLALLEFVGLIVGKALYENIVIQPSFTHTFLSALLGKANYLSQLEYYDPVLYKNLMHLKYFDGDDQDFTNLYLTYSVTIQKLGKTVEIDLIPNGRNISVKKSSRFRYIVLVANYHLNVRHHAQNSAFKKGFFHCVNNEWISMFSQPELQVLISGRQKHGFSVRELKLSSRIAPSRMFVSDRIHVSRFWAIMEDFNMDERALLLKFVTSCEREPLLGFASLNPPFTIQVIPINNDDAKLPSASTCFNILKLPAYSSKKVMKEKLRLAIRSESGFEMS